MNVHDTPLTRRNFVKTSIAASLGAWSLQALAAEPVNGMPYRVLGKTGEKVSLVGLGGFHVGIQKNEDDSIRLVRTAIDGGINFLDNCWDYNRGVSEVRMGKALRDGYRERAFLMTKIDGRNQQNAAQQIDESLQRLQTDHIDLLQFHEIIRTNDPERIFAEGGAFEAVRAAQKAGKVRYIGFTGHKNPSYHLQMLDTGKAHGVHFDAVQMPLNVMDAHYESFASKVVPRLVEEGIGVLGMKSMGGGNFVRSGTVSAVECLQYAMNLPTSVVITGCDTPAILEQALTTARSFKPFEPAALAVLLAKTAPLAADGKMEIYKSTSRFDGTAQNPQWLG